MFRLTLYILSDLGPYLFDSSYDLFAPHHISHQNVHFPGLQNILESSHKFTFASGGEDRRVEVSMFGKVALES